MSDQVNATAQIGFKNDLEMTLNQTKSYIWPILPEARLEGNEKAKVKDLIGNVKAQRGDIRRGATQYNNTPHDGVWMVKPEPIYFADTVDKSDQVATYIGLTGAYTMTAAATIARGKDDAALAGIFGSIISGKSGTTTTAFPAGMTIPVTTGAASGNARMNVDKLRAARKLLAAQHNDMQAKRYIVLTAEQSDDLLTQVPATSMDFKESYGGMVDPQSGRLTRLLGFDIIELELSNPLLDSSLLAVDGSGFRKNPFWVQGGVVKGVWDELTTSIDVLPQMQMATQVWASCIVAATRTQAGKVGIILNSEA